MAMNPQVMSSLCPRKCGRTHRKVRRNGEGSAGALARVLRHRVRQLRGCECLAVVVIAWPVCVQAAAPR